MTFIITVISLIIERFLHWGHLRYWRWYFKFQHAVHLRTENWPTVFGLLLCILPLIIVVGLIQFLLAGVFFGLLQLVFGVLVLVYCLGPNNLWVDTYQCIKELNANQKEQANIYNLSDTDL